MPYLATHDQLIHPPVRQEGPCHPWHHLCDLCHLHRKTGQSQWTSSWMRPGAKHHRKPLLIRHPFHLQLQQSNRMMNGQSVRSARTMCPSDPSGLFPPPHSLELRDATSLQISETKMLTGSSQWWFRIRYFGPPKNPLISGPVPSCRHGRGGAVGRIRAPLYSGAGIIVGGDFKRFLFSPVVGEDFQLDLFLRWVETSN